MVNDPFSPPPGMNPIVFRLLLWKRYFDTGYALTSYVKWFIAALGFASRDVAFTIAMGLVYVVFCLILGWAWHRYGLAQAEIEVGNRFNAFVNEMRASVGRQPGDNSGV